MAELVPSSTNPAGDAFLDLYQLVRRRVDKALSPHSSSVSRVKLLMILDAEGPTRISALSAALAITVRSVIDALESLERDRLIARHRDPQDRRAVLASITTAGRDSLRAAHRTRKRVMDEIFGGLSDDEQMRLLEILAKLRKAV